MNKITGVILVVIILALTLAILGMRFFSAEDGWICQNGQWAKHGNPSAPAPQEGCGSNAKSEPQKNSSAKTPTPEETQVYLDGVKIFSPQKNATVTSPLSIRGEAPGYWFFEGSMPVKIIDNEGNLIVQHYLTAKGEWMTENLVPFEGTLQFSVSGGGPATLVISQDDPSGLGQVKEIKIPVNLSP